MRPRPGGGGTPSRRGTRQQAEAESGLRTDGRHCPVCLHQLARLATTGRFAQRCGRCGAEPQPGRRCRQCHRDTVWEAELKAACQGCGHHGSRVRVVVGVLEEEG